MTSLPGPTAEEQVVFLGKVERVLSEGQYVATYKYALLLAIANLAVKHGRDDGCELDVPIRAIAEEFIELYWRQSAPYGNTVADGSYNILQQNTGRQAAIISIIENLRQAHGTLMRARQSPAWDAAVTEASSCGIDNVSRPHLVKLLGEGAAPHHKTGKYRRVRFENLMRFKGERDRASVMAMEALAKQAQELEMGYQ